MVVTNIIGGLGNQMFQYAAGLALSLENGVDVAVTVDMFEGYTLHNGYELGRIFGIDAPVWSAERLRGLIGWRAFPISRRILAKFPLLDPLWGQHFCVERSDAGVHSLFHTSGGVYLHGYWQSELYFRGRSDEIRSAFKFPDVSDERTAEVLADILAHKSVSLHVRRGDYVNSKNAKIYSQCSPTYYLSGMRYIQERAGVVKFFIFSDDPDWAGLLFAGKGFDCRVVSHNEGVSSYNDMRLMSACDHHIIANSSFSWWGAWLNPNLNRIVIAPRQWMIGTPSSRIVPDSWVLL